MFMILFFAASAALLVKRKCTANKERWGLRNVNENAVVALGFREEFRA